jgi:hypothetical protein
VWVANALNPNRVLDEFKQETVSSIERFDQLIHAIGSNGASLGLRRALAGDAVFKLGTLWEVFQHKWHVASVSRSPFVLRTRIQNELDDALRKGPAAHILTSLKPEALAVPARLKVAEIERLLDPDGYNLSFKDCEVWARRADADLDPRHADLVRAIVQDAEAATLVALLKALRNALAHSSAGSMKTFNSAARRRPTNGGYGLVGQGNAALVRDSNRVRDVGTYLYAWVHGSQRRRIHLLHSRIAEVAERLRLQ